MSTDQLNEHTACPVNRAQWNALAHLQNSADDEHRINRRMTSLVNRHLSYGCHPSWEIDLMPYSTSPRPHRFTDAGTGVCIACQTGPHPCPDEA